MINNHENQNLSISSGWDVSRKSWPLPNVDTREEIRNSLPSSDLVVHDIEKAINLSKNSPSELYANDPKYRENGDLFNIPLQSLKAINYESLSTENPEIKRHIKGLFQSLRKGENLVAAFDGRFLRVSSKDLIGNDINTIYDFKSPQNSLRTGIEITSLYTTNENKESFDAVKLAPENSKIFYHKKHWLLGVVFPFSKDSIASIDGKNIAVFDNFVSRKDYSPASVIFHEGQHIKDNLNGKDFLGWLGVRTLLPVANILTPFLMYGISPWLLVPSIALNLIMYMLSRSKGNSIGKGFSTSLATEAKAYYTQGILEDYLSRKGFMSFSKKSAIDTASERFNALWLLGYQPLSFTAIDLMRSVGSNKEKEAHGQKVNASVLA